MLLRRCDAASCASSHVHLERQGDFEGDPWWGLDELLTLHGQFCHHVAGLRYGGVPHVCAGRQFAHARLLLDSQCIS